MGTSSASLCWARERISSWPGVKQVLVDETTAKFRSGLGRLMNFSSTVTVSTFDSLGYIDKYYFDPLQTSRKMCQFSLPHHTIA